MAVTATKTNTLADVLDKADPDQIADALRLIKLGRMLNPLKVTFAAITAVAAPDLTTFKVGDAGVTVNQGLTNFPVGTPLPPVLDLTSLRVTASGTGASLGTYTLTDTGGTAIVPPGGASVAVGIAKLSDDGKTITFPNTVTGFVIEYTPRSFTDPTTKFEK